MSTDSVIVLVAVAACLNGLLVGVMIRDWWVRKQQMTNVENTRSVLSTDMTKIAQAHNNMAGELENFKNVMKVIQDKVDAREMRGLNKISATSKA